MESQVGLPTGVNAPFLEKRRRWQKGGGGGKARGTVWLFLPRNPFSAEVCSCTRCITSLTTQTYLQNGQQNCIWSANFGGKDWIHLTNQFQVYPQTEYCLKMPDLVIHSIYCSMAWTIWFLEFVPICGSSFGLHSIAVRAPHQTVWPPLVLCSLSWIRTNTRKEQASFKMQRSPLGNVEMMPRTAAL